MARSVFLGRTHIEDRHQALLNPLHQLFGGYGFQAVLAVVVEPHQLFDLGQVFLADRVQGRQQPHDAVTGEPVEHVQTFLACGHQSGLGQLL